MRAPAPPGHHRSLIPYFPALDGFRAVAVVAVLLFHSHVPGAGGGFLGVTAFFVLSGFLMGGLLLVERAESGRIDLRAFWGRRARRLVPAALVLIGVVIAYLTLATGNPADGVVGDGFASAGWVANWRFVLDQAAYGDLFSEPSPFQHMWSLAVEEQFYLLLPLGVMLLLGRSGAARPRRLAWAVVAAIVASTLLAAVLHVPGSPPGRAYYGTDTRAAEPLVGVLLAIAVFRRRRDNSPRQRLALEVLGLSCLAGLVAMIVGVTERADVLYRGGFLLAAVLSAGVVLAATEPKTLVARALAVPPLVSLGRISYGVYLYHWPAFLLLDEQRTGFSPGPLFVVRCATTLALAVLSYFLVERPVRWGALRPRVGAIGWANATVGLLAGLVLVASTASAPNVSMLASGPTPEAPPLPDDITPTTAAPAPPVTSASPAVSSRPRQGQAAGSSNQGPSRRDPLRVGAAPDPSPPAPPAPPPGPQPLKVAIVGDSMARGLADGMTAWAAPRDDVVVYDLAVSACALAWEGDRRWPDGSDVEKRRECPWWSQPGSDRSKKFDAFDPDIVVMQDGFNEMLDRKLESWSHYRRPGDTVFDEWLTRRYGDVLGRLTAGGAKIVILDPVCADWAGMGWWAFNEGESRLAAVDRITEGLADLGHVVGQLSKQVCPEGRFTQTVAGVDNARPDGYHLSKEAATALARQWLGPLVLGTVKPHSPSSGSAGTQAGP